MPEPPLIALDARLVGYAAGIARYTELLAAGLSELNGPEEYVALRSRRHLEQRIGGPRVRQQVCLTPPHHRLERLSLPIDVMRARRWPALLHSTDHVAPAWGPWRSVVTLHDLAFLLYPGTHTAASRAYYAATGASARHAQRVIAVSQRTASDAVRLLGLDPTRVRVVHEAAAPSFSPRPYDAFAALADRLGLPTNPAQPLVLFVGTLEPRKNLALLFEAMASVRRAVDAHLVLVGARGWLDQPIYAAHARSGVGEAAHFVGRLDEQELALLYSHAGVFVLPSLYEGFGLPILEAMACGTPVVCSNAGPLPEVAGDAALLLEPSDPAEWARSMLRVMTDRRMADDLRTRGFSRAAAFSWRRAAEATRDVYREALLA